LPKAQQTGNEIRVSAENTPLIFKRRSSRWLNPQNTVVYGPTKHWRSHRPASQPAGRACRRRSKRDFLYIKIETCIFLAKYFCIIENVWALKACGSANTNQH
jgi:hypothetical protein